MVECELLSEFVNFYSNYVLIDTWWNVNYHKFLLILTMITVLIDTWWNVNISAKDVVNNAIHVLIDTWWNVNC